MHRVVLGRSHAACAALVLVLLAASTKAALGDTVTPSDRVKNSVNVRADPQSDLTIVGKLRPGEHAEYLGEIQHWFEVRLPDGTHGFVSRAWTERVTTAPVVSAETIRLGAWNTKKLGWGSLKNYSRLAEVINDNFDILAVTLTRPSRFAPTGT